MGESTRCAVLYRERGRLGGEPWGGWRPHGSCRHTVQPTTSLVLEDQHPFVLKGPLPGRDQDEESRDGDIASTDGQSGNALQLAPLPCTLGHRWTVIWITKCRSAEEAKKPSSESSSAFLCSSALRTVLYCTSPAQQRRREASRSGSRATPLRRLGYSS